MLASTSLGTERMPVGGLGIDRLIASSFAPAAETAKRRNTALDWFFYDVGNLTAVETAMLVADTNREGSILVVWPAGDFEDIGVRKFADYERLRDEPGKLLQRFAIAGVGSSDIGAAAFARTVADRYGEPVGAIVAGYGVADLLDEALGGWFVLGAANRLMQTSHKAQDRMQTLARRIERTTDLASRQALEAARPVVGRDDAETLVRLLLDEDRTIKSVAGHSKGCLSIAYALEALVLAGAGAAVEKAKAARVTTVGAVVELPRGFTNVGQYLGTLDWFGGMNSRPDVTHEKWPGAWHHLNTMLPASLDFAAVLAKEPD